MEPTFNRLAQYDNFRRRADNGSDNLWLGFMRFLKNKKNISSFYEYINDIRIKKMLKEAMDFNNTKQYHTYDDDPDTAENDARRVFICMRTSAILKNEKEFGIFKKCFDETFRPVELIKPTVVSASSISQRKSPEIINSHFYYNDKKVHMFGYDANVYFNLQDLLKAIGKHSVGHCVQIRTSISQHIRNPIDILNIKNTDVSTGIKCTPWSLEVFTGVSIDQEYINKAGVIELIASIHSILPKSEDILLRLINSIC